MNSLRFDEEGAFTIYKSDSPNHATIIEFFLVDLEQVKSIESSVAVKFSICTNWLKRQQDYTFKKYVNLGLSISFEIGGWLDNDNQLYDFVIPPNLLRELGRLDLPIEFTLNDYYRY
ncbi:MAG: hypothetical protein OEM02_15835 [Desulfobulbaceae bacterium]|nr:hypothetical protein [Desulfobulbaceae bacterium]